MSFLCVFKLPYMVIEADESVPLRWGGPLHADLSISSWMTPYVSLGCGSHTMSAAETQIKSTEPRIFFIMVKWWLLDSDRDYLSFILAVYEWSNLFRVWE